MTETEWLESIEPWEMVEFVRERASGRKLRLLACAACSRAWNPFVPPLVLRAVAAAGAFADDAVSTGDLAAVNERAVRLASDAAVEMPDGSRSGYAVYTAEAAAYATGASAWHAAAYALAAAALAACDADFHTLSIYGAGHHTGVAAYAGWQGSGIVHRLSLGGIQGPKIPARHMPPEYAEELAAQTELLRDIFGNPFRSSGLELEWFTDTAIALARTMYESRDFSAMPILADALQDAGCDDDDILGHCRAEREHVRGCWVVDLLLGKA